MSGGTPKGRSKGGDSAARGRRMADKARGPRPERPRPERLEPDDSADIGVEARIAAGLLLNGALIRRGGLDEALALPAVSNLPGPDRAFARAVAMAALRRLGEIDQILNHRLQKSPPEAVRTILRIALAQTLVLETPAFAAVSTAVKLAERDPKTRPYKNLVNAVLRGIGREGPGLTTAESNLPDWLVARWRQTYGDAALAGLALAAREEPPTDLTLKPGANAEALAELVEGVVLPGGEEGVAPGQACVPVATVTWPAGPALRTASGGCRTRRPPCRCGCWPHRRVRRRWTCARHPGARPCNWPRPAPWSRPWTGRRRG